MCTLFTNAPIDNSLTLPPVKASAPLLIEVFEGLIRNALEAMPHGGKLSIRGGVMGNASKVWLQFADTGQGISELDLKLIFTPFFTTKGHGVGMGLGLWLSRLYLQTIGGDIGVESKYSLGTTFTVRFPALPSDVQFAMPSPETVESEQAIAENNLDAQVGSARVLIVEDDPIWRGYLSPIIQARGLHVCVARHYEAAVRALQDQEFGAFVIDVRLVDQEQGNRDGLRFAHEVLRHQPGAPLLILSGWLPELEAAKHHFDTNPCVKILDKAAIDDITRAIDQLCRHLVPNRPATSST